MPAPDANGPTLAGSESSPRWGIPTALEREVAEQHRWRLRPAVGNVPWFHNLLRNEFLPPDTHRQFQHSALARIVNFAVEYVPYYRDLCRRDGLNAAALLEPGGLARLPPLTRDLVQRHAAELQPLQLPPGERPGGMTKTSGTTGQPVHVRHTFHSMMMFSLLAQREARWFRFDPMQTCAQLRPGVDLPRRPDGQVMDRGDVHRSEHWPLLGRLFETGPQVAMSNLNPVEDQLRWLADAQPRYLIGLSADLEQLALSYSGDGSLGSLEACQAISQQLTPSMRRLIGDRLQVELHEDYGLNEIGLVAVRCPEAGRYHVHAEHCLVEIVDEQGRPCGPGERGRLLVTGLGNAAMPLLRYDADDLAEVADGPCPCGRTLPAFAALHGRYRRTAYLPPDTWIRWEHVLRAFEHLPPELAGRLRRYQLHQHRDGRFDLRLVTSGDLPDALVARIEQEWKEAGHKAGSAKPLTILHVDEIPRPRGGKFQNFLSDFAPPEEAVPDRTPPSE